MGILDWIFSKKSKKEPERELSIEEFNALFEHHNYLGSAAMKKSEALQAIKENRYDDAWRLLHEKKHLLLQHATEYGYDASATIAMDGTVHQYLANILRLEGKHDLALIHCVYWIKSSAPSGVTKEQLKRLPAYLNRSSVNKNDHQRVIDYATEASDGLADLSRIQSSLSKLFNSE